jgi:hypothetical protein
MASTASLQSVWRRLAIQAGRDVEAYRVFRRGVIERELRRHGFRIRAVHKQFVLPIALHKSIGSLGFTKTVEGGLAAVGMLRLAGSPVTVAAERCAS